MVRFVFKSYILNMGSVEIVTLGPPSGTGRCACRFLRAAQIVCLFVAAVPAFPLKPLAAGTRKLLAK
jgi:hypothetical protein